jgi:hypothetical protein
MEINKLTKAWRLLKAWPLLVIFAMVSCVDVVQERVNGGGASFYGSDEVDMIPASLSLTLDDSGFFLASATDITSITGSVVGCDSGKAAASIGTQTPEILGDGSAKLEFNIGTGDSNCFLALSALSIDGTAYEVAAEFTGDSGAWAVDAEVDAESGSSSAVIKVVDNIDDDEDPGTLAYSEGTDVDATFTVITKLVGDGVTAAFTSDAESGASATNIPNFSIEANTDGSTADSFSLGRIRTVAASGATFYLLNMQLQCPADIAGSGGATHLLYVRTCDGVSMDATLNHSNSAAASVGKFLWRFALRNRAVTSSSDSLASLYELSAIDSQWTHLGAPEDTSGNVAERNPGYTDSDGDDGCAITANGTTTNYKACIRDKSGSESGGFNLGLESSDFGPADSGDPQLTLVVELTGITTASTGRTATSGGVVSATQDLAYFMIDIDLDIE